jgi:outer membrane receptor protein involved in Fe transport
MTQLSQTIRRCLALATVTSASLYAGATLAAPTELEEVVVTAQKVSQKLSETPLSVTAVSAKDLDAMGAVQFADFANSVPGLTFTSQGVGATQISLRGISAGTDVSPTVGIYVDEVPYGSSTSFAGSSGLALDAALFDIDRIEILRGPQGTLYGASTMGGLLKYVTTAPDVHQFDGTARAGVSTTAHGGINYDVASAVNLPFASDTAALRLGGYYSHEGGYVDSPGTGQKDVDQSNVYGGRADLLFKPNDQLSVRLNAFVQKVTRDGENTVGYDLATEKPLAGNLDQPTILKQPFDEQFELFSGTVVYNFGPATLTSISSYQELTNSSFLDASPLYVPILNAELPHPTFPTFGAIGVAYGIKTDKFTQEVRLAGTGPVVDWLFGGFYTHETSNQTQLVDSYAPDFSPININVGTVALPSSYEEVAGFGTVTWHVTSKLDLAGGLRYSHNSQTFEQDGSGLLLGSNPAAKSSGGVTTYLGNLRYRVADNVMTYARFATGYRPGGPNFIGSDPVTGQPIGNAAFQADKLQSYEVGIKASSNDHRFSADGAVFFINWDNMQIDSARNGVGVVANASTARSTGAELTLSALPVPELSLVGAFAYTHARLTADAPDLGGKDGDQLPNSPEFAGTISADYNFSTASHPASVGTAVRYVGNRTHSFDLNAGDPQYHLPSYTTLDLHGSVAFGTTNLRLYVHNLTDERGQLSVGTVLTQVGGPAMVSIMQPRTFGISVDTKF